VLDSGGGDRTVEFFRELGAHAVLLAPLLRRHDFAVPVLPADRPTMDAWRAGTSGPVAHQRGRIANGALVSDVRQRVISAN
jgi:hypothetical protein